MTLSLNPKKTLMTVEGVGLTDPPPYLLSPLKFDGLRDSAGLGFHPSTIRQLFGALRAKPVKAVPLETEALPNRTQDG